MHPVTQPACCRPFASLQVQPGEQGKVKFENDVRRLLGLSPDQVFSDAGGMTGGGGGGIEGQKQTKVKFENDVQRLLGLPPDQVCSEGVGGGSGGA